MRGRDERAARGGSVSEGSPWGFVPQHESVATQALQGKRGLRVTNAVGVLEPVGGRWEVCTHCGASVQSNANVHCACQMLHCVVGALGCL